MNREDLIVDQRFATQALRALNEDAVDELVENWTKTKTKDEAVKLLAKNKIPAAPVRNLEEVTRDEHMHERGMLHYVTHPIMGNIVLPTSPIRHHRSTKTELNLEPKLGQHTTEVLSDWLKMSKDAIAELRGFNAIH